MFNPRVSHATISENKALPARSIFARVDGVSDMSEDVLRAFVLFTSVLVFLYFTKTFKGPINLKYVILSKLLKIVTKVSTPVQNFPLL